jgi:Lon protease-like protein
VAYTLPLDVAQKADLLAQCNVHTRAEQLLAHLAQRGADNDLAFPPDFSAN